MFFHCQSKSIEKFVHSTMQSTSITQQKQLWIFAPLLLFVRVRFAYMYITFDAHTYTCALIAHASLFISLNNNGFNARARVRAAKTVR